MLPDGNHAPEDGCPNDQDVYGCQRQVAPAKLNRREDQVGYEVDGEGQGDQPSNFASECLHEYKTKADQNDRVEYLPDHPNGGRWRRPAGFGK